MQITINIPDELAEQARDAGLLSETRVAEWISRELKRAEVARELREMAAILRSVEPRLTLEEIEAELAASRDERLAEQAEHTSTDHDNEHTRIPVANSL